MLNLCVLHQGLRAGRHFNAGWQADVLAVAPQLLAHARECGGCAAMRRASASASFINSDAGTNRRVLARLPRRNQ